MDPQERIPVRLDLKTAEQPPTRTIHARIRYQVRNGEGGSNTFYVHADISPWTDVRLEVFNAAKNHAFFHLSPAAKITSIAMEEIAPIRYQRGDTCRVVTGTYKGCDCTILEPDGNYYKVELAGCIKAYFSWHQMTLRTKAA